MEEVKKCSQCGSQQVSGDTLQSSEGVAVHCVDCMCSYVAPIDLPPENNDDLPLNTDI